MINLDAARGKYGDEEIVETLAKRYPKIKVALSTTNSSTGQPYSLDEAVEAINRREGVGRVSAKHESGGDAAAISTGAGDIGGKSYGRYQLASKVGMVDSFLDKTGHREQFADTPVGSVEFDERFKQITEKQPTFVADQKRFLLEENYKPVYSHLRSQYGFDPTQSEAVNELLYSTAMQFGPSNAKKVFDRALAGKTELDERGIIDAVTDVKLDVDNWFKSSPPETRASVANRFNRERQDYYALIKPIAQDGEQSDVAEQVAGGDSGEKTLSEAYAPNMAKLTKEIELAGGKIEEGPIGNIQIVTGMGSPAETLKYNARLNAAAASDAFSLAGRFIRGLYQTLAPDDKKSDVDNAVQTKWQEFKARMGETRSTSDNAVVALAENILLDPATPVSFAIPGAKPAAIGIRTAATGIKASALAAAKTGAKTGIASAVAHQTERYAQEGTVSPLQAAGEIAMSAAIPAVVSGTGVTVGNIVKSLKGQTAHFSDIPEHVLRRAANKTELAKIQNAYKTTGGDLSQMGDDVIDMITNIRHNARGIMEKNAGKYKQYLTDRMSQITENTDEAIRAARPGGGIVRAKGEAGEALGDAAKRAQTESREVFETRLKETLDKSGVGGKPLVPKKSINYETALGKPYRESPAVDAIDDLFFEMGYTGKVTGREVIGETSIPKTVIDHLGQLKNVEVFRNPRSVRELLSARRQLQNAIAWNPERGAPMYSKGSPGDFVMKKLYGKLNSEVESQIKQLAPTEEVGTALAAAFKANNAQAEHAISSLYQLGKKGGLTSTYAESYIDKISKIGTKNLLRIRNLAHNSPKQSAVREVWGELQSGYFDGIVAKSTKDGAIDFQTLRRLWGKEPAALKTLMIGKQKEQQVVKSLDRYLKIKKLVGDIDPQSATFKSAAYKYHPAAGIKKPDDIGKKVVGEKVNVSNTVAKLQSLGTDSKKEALMELIFLEDLYGIPNKNRFSTKALDVYAGKSLHMTQEGGLSITPKSGTGRSMLGLMLGRLALTPVAVGVGAYVGGPQGAAIGGGAAAILGLASQSPAGAVAMYRAFEKMERGLGNEFLNASVKFATRGTTMAISTGAFRGDGTDNNSK